MLIRLLVMDNITVNAADAESVKAGVQKAAGDVMSTVNWTVEPLTIALWIIAVAMVAWVWYAMTEKPYTRFRMRRPVGVGPLTHLRNTVINKINSFLF